MTKTFEVKVTHHFYIDLKEDISENLVREYLDREISNGDIAGQDFDVEGWELVDEV